MHFKKTGGQGVTWHAIGLDTYALSPGNVAAYFYDHCDNQWHKIGDATKQLAVAGGRLFSLSNDHRVFRRSQDKWVEIGSGYKELIEGGDLLYGIEQHSSDIHMYDGSHWHKIGGPGGLFVASGEWVIGISPGADTVYAWSVGGNWAHVGTGYTNLIAGSGRVFGISHNGDIHKWNVGTANQWQKVGGPGAKFVSTQSGLYGINSGHDIYRYNGTGEQWTKVGDNTKGIWGNGNSAFPVIELTNGDVGVLTHY